MDIATIIKYELNEELKNTANEEDIIKGLHVYAAENNVDALYYLAVRYHEGRGVVCNVEKALIYFKLAADQDDELSCWCAGNVLESLAGEKKPLLTEALSYYKRAANLLYLPGILATANFYQHGISFKCPDEKMAFSWYMKAAELGSQESFYEDENSSNVDALYYIGKCFSQGRSFAPKNKTKAATFFKRAAEASQYPNVFEASSLKALEQLGRLATENVIESYIYLPQPIALNSTLPLNLQAAIYFMRKAGTTEAEDWLQVRGISQVPGECANCQKKATVACTDCNMTFFCSLRCVDELGVHWHIPFCKRV